MQDVREKRHVSTVEPVDDDTRQVILQLWKEFPRITRTKLAQELGVARAQVVQVIGARRICMRMRKLWQRAEIRVRRREGEPVDKIARAVSVSESFVYAITRDEKEEE